MRHKLAFVILLFSFILSACTSTSAPLPSKDFELSLDVTSLNLTQGQADYLDIHLIPENGFDSDVKLQIENALPSGVTGSFTQASISSGLAALELRASPTATPGNYTITLKGVAGSVSKTITFSLTVTEMARNFSLTLTPSLVNLVRGETQILNLTAEFTQDFDKEVALSLERKDGGLLDELIEYDLPATAGMWNSLLLTAKSDAPEGQYTFVVKGKAGETVKEVEFTLIISAVPDFAIGVDVDNVTLLPGQTKTLQVTIARAGNYSEAVTLSLKNGQISLPYGLEAKFEPVNPTGNTSTLTLTASETANMFNLQTLEVIGQASGKTRTTSFNLKFDNFIVNIPTASSMNLGVNHSVSVIVGWKFSVLEPVQLALEQVDGSALPEGLSAVFDQSVLSKSSDATTLRLTASEPLVADTYQLRLKATAAGATRFANLTLTVHPKPDFTISLDKTDFEVDQGQSVAATLTINRTNFTSYVTVSRDATNGLFVDTNPYFIYGNSSAIKIRAAEYAQPGTYNFQITVSGNGISRSIPVSVTVKFVPKQFTFTTSVGDSSSGYAPRNIAWFAFQERNKPWQVVTGQDGKYTFDHESHQFTLAMVHVKTREVNVYIEPIDLSGSSHIIGRGFYDGPSTISQGNQYQLTGTVRGVTTGNTSAVYFGGSETSTAGLANYQLTAAQGTFDLSAFRFPQNSTRPDRMIIQRGVSFAQNSTVDLDFESPTSFVPQLFTVSSYGYPASTTSGLVVSSPYYWYSALKLGTGQGTFQYAAIPSQYQKSGERYQVLLSGSCPGNCSTTNIASFDTARDVSLELLEPISSASVSVLSTTPYVLPTAEFAADTSGRFEYSLNYYQENSLGAYNNWFIDILPKNSVETFTLPNFSGLPGWNNEWELNNSPFNWRIQKRVYEDSLAISEYKSTTIYGKVVP
jgi:hypothetical protein